MTTAPIDFVLHRSRLALCLGLVLAGTSCTFAASRDCPDLNQVCPDVQCDDYKQNRDGCSICECEGESPTGEGVCWDDGDCGDGERCDAVTFCERAPGCGEDGPCPDACYGRCVAGPTACASDGDCPAGSRCALVDNARPAPSEGDAPAPAPLPAGVCVDASCEETNVALLPCPPGTELTFDPRIDPCTPVCVAVDPCRELLAEECLTRPGCELIQEPCACELGADCGCNERELCVAVADCGRLSVDECEINPACVLKSASDGSSSSGGGSSGGGSSDPCSPDDPSCGGAAPPPPPPPPPPPDDFVCVPRSPDGACFSDVDCLPGEVCETQTVCGSGCEIDASGQERCVEDCWTEGGRCVPSATSCFALDPFTCANDPRCEVVEPGAPCECAPETPTCDCAEPLPVCQPVDNACASDPECAAGQYCALTESCPTCDPSTGQDLACGAPCFVEGRCVDGPPPPQPCTSDLDCGSEGACVEVTVCTTCEGAPDGSGAAAPCDPACHVENVCASADRLCASDGECLLGEVCDFTAIPCVVEPCPGACRPAPAPLCQDDSHCPDGLRCATELDLCAQNPDDPTGSCWSACVTDSTASAFCLDSSSCGPGEQCRFPTDSATCIDDPASDLAVCSGWCVGACADIETRARDPLSGACVTFPDSCIPPGWTAGC